MRALVLIHRWLGVGFCLLFAMWFASGIVMHFVPFPALGEADRVAGLASFDPSRVGNSPAAAVKASGISNATRVRLQARSDGPVYLVQGAAGVRAVQAGDLTDATVRSEKLASAIALDHARQRGLNATAAVVEAQADYDQWTVPNKFDRHRPLYRIALDDDASTELYVSSATGEIVLDTTRRERGWNYAGSVAHWIYATPLRRAPRAWNALVWTLSLVALIAASAGALLGVLRLKAMRGHLASPFRGWQAWHHWLGLGCMVFILTWLASGWLSMDSGLLFSTGKPAAAEAANFSGAAAWEHLTTRETSLLPAQVREIEWYAFAGRIYRRERLGPASQHLSLAGEAAVAGRAFLQPAEVSAAIARLAQHCLPAAAVEITDNYPVASALPHAPVLRAKCGEIWFDVDGASGALLQKLDASRRAYRWAYGALHTLDFPSLRARPLLRTVLIVTLCGLGLAFSVTATVIAWRRLRASLPAR